MKLKLIRQIASGDRESWRRLSLFEVVEGENYAPPPPAEKEMVDRVWEAAWDELELTDIATPTTEQMAFIVSMKCSMSVERIKDLRYWPEIEDWHSEVLGAAREEGVEVSDAGDGYPGGPFAREPAIGWWPHVWDGSVDGKRSVIPLAAHLTIEQSGGLDI